MTRREFEDSIVGDLKFLWLDAEEVRGIIRRTFAFADNRMMFDYLTVGRLRELMKDPDADPEELERVGREVDSHVAAQNRRCEKRYENMKSKTQSK